MLDNFVFKCHAQRTFARSLCLKRHSSFNIAWNRHGQWHNCCEQHRPTCVDVCMIAQFWTISSADLSSSVTSSMTTMTTTSYLMCFMTTSSTTLYLMRSMTTSSSTFSFPSLMSSMSCKSKKPIIVRQKKEHKWGGGSCPPGKCTDFGGGKCLTIPRSTASPVHNVYFVKYDVTVSFLAQVLNTVTYFVSQVLDTAS